MTWYYGVNKQGDEYSAASSTSSTTGKEVEIVVNNTNITSRQELLNAMAKLTNFIVRSNWPL